LFDAEEAAPPLLHLRGGDELQLPVCARSPPGRLAPGGSRVALRTGRRAAFMRMVVCVCDAWQPRAPPTSSGHTCGLFWGVNTAPALSPPSFHTSASTPKIARAEPGQEGFSFSAGLRHHHTPRSSYDFPSGREV